MAEMDKYKLRAKLQEFEQYIPLNEQQRFGKWAEFVEQMESMIADYDFIKDENEEYKKDIVKLDKLKEAIQKIANWMMEMPEIEIDYETQTDNSKEVDSMLIEIIKKLEKMADENWGPSKKKKK